MTKPEIENLEKLSKILIKKSMDLDLLYLALTHRSFVNETKKRKLENNERLEFIGDAVLELIVSEFLFKNYVDIDEGLLTSFRAALVRTESLADEAKRLGIGEYINMSRGEQSTGGRERPYILANTMEAIIGAIYLSEGYEVVAEFVRNNICYKIEEIIKSRLDLDPKTKLQEMVQEKTRITPVYEMISSNGPDHDKTFVMAVLINKVKLAEGTGKSKQEAEQNAASVGISLWNKFYLENFKNK